jgi:hypothetical protein
LKDDKLKKLIEQILSLEKSNFEKTIALFQFRLKKLQLLQRSGEVTLDQQSSNYIIILVDLERMIECEDIEQKNLREIINDLVVELKYSS